MALSEVRNPSRRPRFRIALVHSLRIGIIALILLLMNWQHARFLSKERASGLDSVTLEQIQTLFPDASSLGVAESHGGRIVLAGETPVGYVIQTFPEAVQYLGFSGPTNCLIGFDQQGKMTGVQILTSRDTRDHVELIQKDQRFLSAMKGLDARQAAAAKVDAVSGATLTSLAILQGVQARLGQQPGSLKFPQAYTVENARKLFPDATEVQQDGQVPELWNVSDAKGNHLGALLSNSPVADELVGYQGPSRAFLAMRVDGTILGLVIDQSFDNEPYVGYARGDSWFAEIFNKKKVEDWAKIKWKEARIEGVSGATMTSQTVAEGLLLAAEKLQKIREVRLDEQKRTDVMRVNAAVTIAIVILGFVIGSKWCRGRIWIRRCYQILLIAVMGFINGDLLSMAMFVGWAQSGIPVANSLGLVVLAAAAIIVPVAAGQNLYCDHICPHGALQQLLPRKWKWKRRPVRLIKALHLVRPILLAVVVLVPMLEWSLSLVDLEPFDAYAWRAAGWATIAIAIGGIILSVFLPMGYCQYGCPTGAVLGYLRRHSHSGRLGRADAIALSLLVLAATCFLWK
ncbi:FMN-binding protein [Planctomicrobium sp. SH527]|uniref:FMN-binding protein n=1 Tax=Planctomicrobium sp. SH527 TaxID=3448123 RepID=UPI003F5B24D5